MAQEGVERSVDLKESHTRAHGGGFDDPLNKSETVVFGDTKMLSETPSRAETVIIINV